MVHLARFLRVTSKAAFRLSPEARRHVLRNEGKPYVLHVICNMEIGGSQKIILDLFERLSDRYRMKILTGHIPFYVRYPDLPIAVLNTDSAIRDFLRHERPDIIHVHYWGLEEWMQLCLDTACALKQEIGFKILENSNNPIQVAYHELVDHYAHVSRFVLDLQTAPIHMGKQSVVYPGVDADEFTFAPTRRDALTAGMVYRLTDDKINADTIEILIRICKTVPGLLIYVIGDGPNLRHFIDRARSEQVRPNIVFTGFVPYERLNEYYEAFNVFLAPVHHESYGVVVPYAMFKGNPVVAFQVDAIEELLPDPNLRVRTEEDFITTVSGVLQGTVATDEIVRHNRSHAERCFSLASALAAYDALYQDLLDARPPSAARTREAAELIQ
jgi:glycosyltransferase involved in cell wall biosynthesis